jgi:hypothetical protein
MVNPAKPAGGRPRRVFVCPERALPVKPFIMTQGGAYVTEVSEHSEGHQQIHFKIAVPENCVRMDFVFGEFIESIPRPLPSTEIIDFVRVIPSDLIMRPGDQLRVTFYEFGDLPAS